MRILIAEDEEVCGKLLQRILERYGECVVARNGQLAVEAFQEAFASGKRYDLVFLDIMMPVKNGQQVLNEIRDYEQENGVPLGGATKVIMTTALDDEENVFEAHVSGCCAYLVKPIDKNKVIQEVRALGFSV
ncbi:MAG: response regulator [Deltaproteobacteria bacterium]|nr:response regulator [Deltaproteobacteria bacterium]